MPDPACQLGYSIVGGVLQLIGALFAGVGLWLAYQRLERRPQFLTNTWSAVQALVRTTHGFYLRRIENPLRRWFGKTPRSQTIRASAASSVAIAGSARVSVSRYGKARVRHDQELEKLRQDLLDLERRHEDPRNDIAEQYKALQSQLENESTAREQADQQVRDYTRDLLAGILELEVIAAVAIFGGLGVANFLPLLTC